MSGDNKSKCSQCCDILSIKLNNLNIIDNYNDINDIIGDNNKELTLCNCKLIYFLDKFSHYHCNIVKLNLTNANISDLPQSILLLKNLENIIIDNNNIKQLSDVICDVVNLKELSISNNNLMELPFNMDKLIKLEILNLSNNKLCDLPYLWMNMNNLITLDISNNLFKQIPNCLRDGMTNITILNVSNNKNMNINGKIFSKNLKKFYAKNNELIKTTFPKWIFNGNLIDIDELNFENTQFHTVKMPIYDNKISLKKLNMRQCKLYDNTLKDILINISSLQHLIIDNIYSTCSGNSFSILPNNYIVNPQTLITINMCNIGLADLSKSIGTFINLTEIYLQKNYISWLPDEICHLKKLQIIDISYNDMIMLPNNLGSITSLNIIDASHNNISSLPSSIINLNNLEFIDLFDNKMTEMPREIESLNNLIALDLELNYFSTDDILSINYLKLRKQLRINKQERSIGPAIIDIDSESSLSKKSWDYEIYSQSDTESIHEKLNDIDGMINEENWDITDDYTDEFDPYDPPPILPQKWQSAHVFYESQFNFCPADLHAPRIKDIIAQKCVNGQLSSLLPFVDGQFDDA